MSEYYEYIKEKIRQLKELIDLIEKELPEKYRLESFKLLASHIFFAEEPKAFKEVTKEKSGEYLAELKEIESFGEFVNSLKEEPRNNAERLTVMLYYITHIETPDVKYVDINKDLVKKYFTQVAWKIPGNLNRDLKIAVKKGYISKDPDDKGYYVLKKGIEYIKKLIEG